MGGQGGFPPPRIVQVADILTGLCRHQPSGVFEDFLQEMVDFDLGTKGLCFLPGEAREVVSLSTKHLYLHDHPVHLSPGWVRK